jgi:hypothetical protein
MPFHIALDVIGAKPKIYDNLPAATIELASTRVAHDVQDFKVGDCLPKH